MNLKLYIRCVWANKATLLASSCIVVFPAIFIFILLTIEDSFWCRVFLVITALGYCLGAFTFGLTQAGMETMRAYERTMEQYRNHGAIKEGLVSKRYLDYCDQQGFRLAIKDINKEKRKK